MRTHKYAEWKKNSDCFRMLGLYLCFSEKLSETGLEMLFMILLGSSYCHCYNVPQKMLLLCCTVAAATASTNQTIQHLKKEKGMLFSHDYADLKKHDTEGGSICYFSKLEKALITKYCKLEVPLKPEIHLTQVIPSQREMTRQCFDEACYNSIRPEIVELEVEMLMSQ